jgi:hypothetical protein
VPEWLAIRDLARRFDCIGQDGRALCALSAGQHSNGKGFFGLFRDSVLGVSKATRKSAVNLHVVEPAEASLNGSHGWSEH